MKTNQTIIAGLLSLAMAVNGAWAGTLLLGAKQDPFAGITLLPPSEPGQYEPILLNPGDLQELPRLTTPQLEAFLGSLSVTPLLSTNALPFKGRGGTFYSLQHPNWPPMPGDMRGLPAWKMNGSGVYLMDDLGYDYNPPKVKAKSEAVETESATAMTLSVPLRVVAGGILNPNNLPMLVITNLGAGQLSLTVTNPTAPENYEVITTPNLLTPIGQWMMIAVGTNGQCAFVVNAGTIPTGFYQVIQDTHTIPLWEAADPNNQGTGVLSVWIDSPNNGAVLQ